MAADGGSQGRFHLPMAGVSRLRPGEIVIDLFAGGGGASEALRQALGRDPDIAINHDAAAIGMHAANHPYTQHLTEDVWHAAPRRLVGERPVGWLHASPDCCHFSQAKGGQPRSKATRSLSWVVCKWAGQAAPRILSLENVKQLLGWGPLVAKRDPATGRVVTLDVITDAAGRKVHRVAARGERVPLERQFLVPDKRRAGQTWRRFVAHLQALGYAVEWRRLRACDYGAGTSRERLFVIARRDGAPIRWPAPTHGPGRPLPFVTAADCIDWSIPCPSIFSRRKPLADATHRRIARGIQRFVIDAAEPFIVQCANASASGMPRPARRWAPSRAGPRAGRMRWWRRRCCRSRTRAATASTIPSSRCRRSPARTAASWRWPPPAWSSSAAPAGHPVSAPLPTVTSGAGAARPAGAAHAMGIMTAYLEQAAGGPNSNGSRPRGADEPVSTITSSGSQQQLVAAHLVTLRRNTTGAAATDPLGTVCAQAEHHAVVECTLEQADDRRCEGCGTCKPWKGDLCRDCWELYGDPYKLSPEAEAGALRVAAFLMRYHSTGGQWAGLRAPLTAVTTKDRLALVTVTIRGTPYVIVDIGLRMLRPRELYRATGFPPDYIIDRTADGRPLAGYQQVRMVGNAVSPPPLCALGVANLDPAAVEARAAA
jgi:DNA (cytosine-5)-methyltransferase 1